MFFSDKLGIDLGSVNSTIYSLKRGLTKVEPSLLVRDKKSKRIVAIGSAANKFIGRTSESLEIVRPICEGVIDDYAATVSLIRFLTWSVSERFRFMKTILLTVPAGASQIEKRAFVSACKESGARRVYLIEEVLAASIGAGLPVFRSSGQMIIKIGGGVTEVSVISLGQLISFRHIKCAGLNFDNEIKNLLSRKYNLSIGDETAQKIKIDLGYSKNKDKSINIKGRDVESGMPREIKIGSHEVSMALERPLSQILEGIKEVFIEISPELAADVVERGIVLVGGGAKLQGIDGYLTHHTGMVFFVVERAHFVVSQGMKAIIENLGSYESLLK